MHVAISNETVSEFVQIAKIMTDCFHSYGIHSATVQPELGSPTTSAAASGVEFSEERLQACQVKCRASCEVLTCCG